MSEEKFEHVYDVYGSLAADQIKIFLEAHGIIVLTSQESAGLALGLTVGPLGLVRVYVSKSQVSEAVSLLKEMENGDLILDLDPDADEV